MHQDDEIDVIKSICPNNPENIVVSRIEILEMAVRDEQIVITARRNKSLTIENYPPPNTFKSSTAWDDTDGWRLSMRIVLILWININI